MPMLLIPAIDLINGQCVRLHQGDYHQKTTYQLDPIKLAQNFQHQGAKLLHIIDLDGAKAQAPQNQNIIKKIRNHTSLELQVGGGIRTIKHMQQYLDIGIDHLIIGTSALKPQLLKKALQSIPTQKLTISIDIKNDQVATEGWTKTNHIPVQELIQDLQKLGLQRFIITDISRDGTLQGINPTFISRIRKYINGQLIIAGGVKNHLDLFLLDYLQIDGAISGKAILEGHLSFPPPQDNPYQKIKFNEQGLIPAIIQDHHNQKILMLGYLNRESLYKTLTQQTIWFYSRSQKKLWHKGSTSGNYLKLHSITTDCDYDTLLITASQQGPATCHTGQESCFHIPLFKKTSST